MSHFVGAKGGAGVWQRIISEMPPHTVYIEAFAGTGTILRKKKTAFWNIAVDLDAETLARLKLSLPSEIRDRTKFCQMDATAYLPGAVAIEQALGRTVLLYADPPYLMETRRAGRRYYRHEFASLRQHFLLLAMLRSLPCYVALSGYRSALYDQALAHWRRIDIPTSTRGGPAVECLWLNFAPPIRLHDPRWLGQDFRARERIKRKVARWSRRLMALPAAERFAMFDTLACLLARNDEPVLLARDDEAGPHRQNQREDPPAPLAIGSEAAAAVAARAPRHD